MIVAWTPTDKSELNLERIIGCACTTYGALIAVAALHSVVAIPKGWVVVLGVLVPMVAGGTFARFGAWRPRDSCASAVVAFALFALLSLLRARNGGLNVGKFVIGATVLAVLCAGCMATGAWLVRRVIGERPIGGGALLLVAALLTTTFITIGALVAHRLTSSSIVRDVVEVVAALLAGMATQRIAPVRNRIACGGGAAVVVAAVLVDRYLVGKLALDAENLSSVFLIAAGFCGAALGAKLRREPPPTFREFD